MYTEGNSHNAEQTQDNDPHSRWIGQRVSLESALEQAEEKLRSSNGREEYSVNIRARDSAKKALEEWDRNPPAIEYTVADLEELTAIAEDMLKHAKDQQEYENAIATLEMLSEKIRVLKATGE